MRVFVMFFAVAVILATLPADAHAGCEQEADFIDRLICSDTKLASLEKDIARAHTAAVAQSAAADLPFVPSGRWREALRAFCSRDANPGMTDKGLRTCARTSGMRLLEDLKGWPGKGHVQMLTADGLDRAACTLTLDRANIAWNEWPEGVYRPHPSVPKGAGEPDWVPVDRAPFLHFARFDILNDGVVRDVYETESPPESYGAPYHWYIAVAVGEEAVIRQRVVEANSLGELVEGLRTPGPVYLQGPWKEIFGPTRKPASLTSLLIDAARSDFYGGRYAESRIFMMEGVTYIMAIDQGYEASLLRPVKDGSPQALCRHVVVPARQEWIVEVLSTGSPCPHGAQTQSIPWQGDSFDNSSAAIALKDWGGVRMVTRRIEPNGAHYATKLLLVGPLGDATTPMENQWPPVDDINARYHDTEIILTEAGGYVSATNWIPLGRADHPLGTTYFKIADNAVAPVCRVTAKTILPPGYAVRD